MVANPIQSEQLTKKSRSKTNLPSFWWIVISLAVSLFIRTFLFAPFVVNGASMEPNFHHGDRMFVSKAFDLQENLKRGDVIVFDADKKSHYIKRVIATEGETVHMKSDQLYINGTPVHEGYIDKAVDYFHQKGLTFTNDFGPVTVPIGSVFVLGDNRVDSTDSRDIGPIKKEDIIGRVGMVFWSSP